MSNIINFQEYKAKRNNTIQGFRLGEEQFKKYVERTTEGFQTKRIRTIDGEPIIVMQLDSQMLFIEYDGFEIMYDRDTIEAP